MILSLTTNDGNTYKGFRYTGTKADKEALQLLDESGYIDECLHLPDHTGVKITYTVTDAHDEDDVRKVSYTAKPGEWLLRRTDSRLVLIAPHYFVVGASWEDLQGNKGLIS